MNAARRIEGPLGGAPRPRLVAGTSPGPASKLAPITLGFWIAKVLATTLGETAGDFLSMTMQLGYALSAGLLVMVFVGTFGLQLRSRRYHPVRYWLVILSTSIAGTTLSDLASRSLGLGYIGASMLLAVLLGVVLFAWRRVEGSWALDGVTTPRAEAFFWSAILISNTLGTALGDLLSDDGGLGFAGGAASIGVLLAGVALAWRFTSADRAVLIWAGVVLKRPLGATVGDLLTKPASEGGLELGTMVSSLALSVALCAAVAFAAWRERERPAA